MQPCTRRRGRWLLAITGLLMLGLTFSSPLPPLAPRSLQHGWQLGHVLLFAVWTLLLYPALARRRMGPVWRLLIVLLLSLLAGMAIEIGQIFTGREFSFRDLLFDLTGTLLPLCFLAHRRAAGMERGTRQALYGVTAVLLAFAFVPLVAALVDEYNMRSRFPRLADFNLGLEKGRWRGRLDMTRLASPGGRQNVLCARLDTRHYSGFSLNYFPRDWRGYRQLQFELYNPDRLALPLTLRIHDEDHYRLGGDYHDRFNRRFVLHPGWNSISVSLSDVARAPRGRSMDMQGIQTLGLFAVDLPRPRTVCIDSVRLAGPP